MVGIRPALNNIYVDLRYMQETSKTFKTGFFNSIPPLPLIPPKLKLAGGIMGEGRGVKFEGCYNEQSAGNRNKSSLGVMRILNPFFILFRLSAGNPSGFLKEPRREGIFLFIRLLIDYTRRVLHIEWLRYSPIFCLYINKAVACPPNFIAPPRALAASPALAGGLGGEARGELINISPPLFFTSFLARGRELKKGKSTPQVSLNKLFKRNFGLVPGEEKNLKKNCFIKKEVLLDPM